MKLLSHSFRDGRPIPGRCAFGVIDRVQHLRLSDNRNPGLSWSETPKGAKSFVLIVSDPDVPSKPDDVNQEGRVVSRSLPRVEFIHWVMVDIPPDVAAIAEGACSDGVTAKGKRRPPGPKGSRQGVNDYTAWFKGDRDMTGTYLGYDGPCPPWNDELPHRYRFELYAADFARCPVNGEFTAADARKALEGHVLDRAQITGLYTLNPAIRLE